MTESMTRRLFVTMLLAGSLAGCQQAQERASDQALAKAEAQQSADATTDDRILCALGDSTDFKRVCSVDREATDKGLVLTVRHPDGGFHRLLVTNDGRGVVAADGAEQATVTIVGASDIQVKLGGDRYRLPATIKGAGGQRS